jgi:TonB family protein
MKNPRISEQNKTFEKMFDNRILNHIYWWWVLLPLDKTMMRSIFVATLALTPALLHAQATVPAQTASPAVLSARFAPVADIKAAASKNGAPAASTPSTVRVSTGVVGPKLLNPITLANTSENRARVASTDVTVVVTMTVDETGKPQQVALSQAADNVLGQEVVAAISQARFKPGTLDGQAFALPLRLRVVIERGTEY